MRKLHPVVAPPDAESALVKQRIGAFSGQIETLLRASGVDALVLAGITTGGSVQLLSAVRRALELD